MQEVADELEQVIDEHKSYNDKKNDITQQKNFLHYAEQ